MALVGAIAVAGLALSVDVNLSPRLQRGDWRGLAQAIREEQSQLPPAGGSAGAVAGTGAGRRARVITTVELGAAPLEYYLPPLHNVPLGASVRVSEIDETGYPPLVAGAGEPPAPGFRLAAHRVVNGLVLYRFLSATPRTVPESALREHAITAAHPEVLVP